ncbi:hypothetical protein ANOBCDAF_04576 [Pleomorphomonas sp. T1.2MG-36]|nr:hypothetical protein ANOBCDAF_04576 [Pleomorphomonas sp. T1.2MG-36]
MPSWRRCSWLPWSQRGACERRIAAPFISRSHPCEGEDLKTRRWCGSYRAALSRGSAISAVRPVLAEVHLEFAREFKRPSRRMTDLYIENNWIALACPYRSPLVVPVLAREASEEFRERRIAAPFISRSHPCEGEDLGTRRWCGSYRAALSRGSAIWAAEVLAFARMTDLYIGNNRIAIACPHGGVVRGCRGASEELASGGSLPPSYHAVILAKARTSGREGGAGRIGRH